MTGLEGFSDWVLALLPRLFLYPGGAWLLAALLGLRLVSGGLSAIKLHALALDLLNAPLAALSTAWVAVSLGPLPGGSPLAAPVDTLALVALVLVSLSLESGRKEIYRMDEGLVSLAMALGVLGSGVPVHLLPGYAPEGSISSWLAMLCVAAGLVASVPVGGRDLARGVRWLAWMGLGFVPVLKGWADLPITGIYWTSLVYVVAIAIFAFAYKGLAHYKYIGDWEVKALTWCFALLALLAGVMGY